MQDIEWIAHDGKGMPVAGDVMVEVLLQCETFDDYKKDPRPANAWGWELFGDGSDITHYKVIAND